MNGRQLLLLLLLLSLLLLLLGTGGPLPAPHYDEQGRVPQMVLDWRAPAGHMRAITDEELWQLRERRGPAWDLVVAEKGDDETVRAALRGPGVRVAEVVLLALGTDIAPFPSGGGVARC